MCIPEPYTISGDYSSQAVSHLVIQFEKCVGEDKCADEAEIREWLRRKFILTLRNEHNFYQGQYDKDKVASYSKIRWYPINSQQRIEYANEIQQSVLVLYDYMTLGELVVEEADIF